MLVVLYLIISQNRRARRIKYMGIALRVLRLFCEKVKFNNRSVDKFGIVRRAINKHMLKDGGLFIPVVFYVSVPVFQFCPVTVVTTNAKLFVCEYQAGSERNVLLSRSPIQRLASQASQDPEFLW